MTPHSSLVKVWRQRNLVPVVRDSTPRSTLSTERTQSRGSSHGWQSWFIRMELIVQVKATLLTLVSIYQLSGSLISRRHVVTAAHCVAVNNPSSQDSSSNIVVRLGDSDLSTEYDCLGRRCRKSGWVKHKEFSISFDTFRSRTRSCFSDGECAPR